MKLYKRLLGAFLTFVFVLTTFTVQPITAKAYNYTINIMLACSGDEGAEYIPLSEMISSKTLSLSNGKADIQGNTLKLTGLNYGDKVSFNPQAAIKLKEDSKYYVKGMRIAGTNNVLAAGAFDVFEDQTYVIAYGVGDIVPYIVHYVDKNGNKLLEDTTYYSAAGEAVYIPYKHIDGYAPLKASCNYDDKLTFAYPNAYNIPVKHLPELDKDGKPAEYTFMYSKGGETNVITNEVEITETTTSIGEVSYTFLANKSSAQNAAKTANRTRRNGGSGHGHGDSDEADGNGNGNGAAEDDELAVENDESDDTASDDLIEIDDEATAKAGGEKSDFTRNMIIAFIIALLAILVILVALYIAEKKKRIRHKNRDPAG